MKTKQNMRRLVAFTLATAVTLPQGSPALAASLEFTKASVVRLSEQRLTTALTKNQGESAEKQFPLLTMATKTNGASTKLAEAKWRTQLISDEVGMDDPHLTLPVDNEGQEENGSDDISSSDPDDDTLDPTQTDRSGGEIGGGGQDVSTPSDKGEDPSKTTEEKTGEPAGEKTPETVVPEETTDADDTRSQDDLAPDSNEDGVDSPAQGGDGSVQDDDATGEEGSEGSEPGDENTGDQGAESGGPEGEDTAGQGTEGQGSEDENAGNEDPADGDLTGEETEGEAPEDAEDEDVEGENSVDGDEEGSEDEGAEDAAGEDAASILAAEDGIMLVDEAESVFKTTMMYNYVLGYGLGLNSTVKDDQYLSTFFEDRFRVELSDTAAKLYPGFHFPSGMNFGTYGSRIYSGKASIASTTRTTGYNHTLCIFPSMDLLGRVPDYEFAGWYLYPRGVKTFTNASGYSEAAGWYYGDYSVNLVGAEPVKVETDSFDPDDVGVEGGLWAITGTNRNTYSYQNLGDAWDAGRSYGADNVYGEKYDYGAGTTLDAKNPVSFVGRWVYSTESRAADTSDDNHVILGEDGKKLNSAVTVTVPGKTKPEDLYSQRIDGTPTSELGGLSTTFGRSNDDMGYDEQTYYLRVGADVDALDLEFHAAEIFYRYFFPQAGDVVTETVADGEDETTVTEKKLSPVQIVYTYGVGDDAVTFNYSQDGDLAGYMLPLWNESKGNEGQVTGYTPNNSTKDSAHSKWAVKGIGLQASYPTQVPDEEGQPTSVYVYNEIKITVMSPSVYAEELAKWTKDPDSWTAPAAGDGVSTYTFYVQKLSDPTLTLKPGNTPAGMIMRDSWLADQEMTEAALALFKDNYYTYTETVVTEDDEGNETTETKTVTVPSTTKQYQFDGEWYPQDEENNAGGMIFRDTYTTAAWQSWIDANPETRSNIDLDETAIVVYLNSVFDDPGIILIDSEGNPVAANKSNVKRTLTVNTASELSIPTLTATNKTTATYTYSGMGQIDFSGKDDNGNYILPGIYTLKYEFTDAVTGKSYTVDTNSSWATDEGKKGAASFERTLVVLPIPGDVDMDGVVTSADAVVLREYLTDESDRNGVHTGAKLNGVELGYVAPNADQKAKDVTAVADLFAYRVADVNHDGALDNQTKSTSSTSSTTDVTHLETVPTPRDLNIPQESDRLSWSDFYYIELTEQAASSRVQWADMNSTTQAQVELVYLGKEGGSLQDGGYVTNPTGPWNAISNGNMEKNDIMWVGVKLTGNLGDLAEEYVDTFTFTLIYDAQYLRPATVLTETQLGSLNGTEAWKHTLEIYNTTGATVWGQNKYVFTGALESARAFTSYDTKLEMPLETALKKTGTGANNAELHLRELVFSVKANAVSNMVQLSTGTDGVWLLAVPFRMVKHPGADETIQKVEMVAGMSDFTIVFRDGNTSGSKLTTAVYNPFLDDNNNPVEIFGGVNQNLAEYIKLANAGPQVPLGENKEQIYYIRHETQQGIITRDVEPVYYSTPFSAQYGWVGTRDVDGNITYTGTVERLPALSVADMDKEGAPSWLTFDRTTGTLSGTPQAANEDGYYFYIGDLLCCLVVEKAPIHYWADSVNTYYGETKYRSVDNEPSPDFTFSYDPDDILSIEQAFAKEHHLSVDGKGAGLESLLTHTAPANDGDDTVTHDVDETKLDYTAPQFTAVVDANANIPEAITFKTPVRTAAYEILETVKATSSNYVFIYTPERAIGDKGVKIEKRPFEVVKLTAKESEPVGTIFSDQTTGEIPGLTIQLGGGKVQLKAQRKMDEDGYFNGLPLTANAGYTDGVLLSGDSIILQYKATLLQNEQDKAAGGSVYYDLGDKQSVTRAVKVTDLTIIGGYNSENYVLYTRDDRANGDYGMPLITGEDEGPHTEDEIEKTHVVGIVRRRNIISFEIKQTPPMKYQAGEQLSAYDQLRFNIVREGDADTTVDADENVEEGENGTTLIQGTYTYHPETTYSRFGITVSWATPAEKAAKVKGSKEYTPNQTFTTEYNGCYLCLSAEVYTSEGLKTITTYSDTQLEIEARTLTLSAVAASRYYGETDNALRFTYDPSELSVQDRQLLRDMLHIENLGTARRDGSELNRLFEEMKHATYHKPTLTAVDISKIEVDQATGERLLTGPGDENITNIDGKTKANETTYVVLISDAAYEGYDIQYTYGYFNSGNWIDKGTQSDWGASRFQILPRPIVVEGLLKQGSDSEIGLNLVTIYADTKKLDVDGRELSLNDVALGVPVDEDQVVRYYSLYAKTLTTQSMGYTGTAVVNGDENGLSLTYTATVVSTDTAYVQWTDFSKGHFNMSGAVNGNKKYPVQVSNLTLIGNKASNYQLVYRDTTSAGIGGLAQWEAIEHCVKPNANANGIYYIPKLITVQTTTEGQDGTETVTQTTVTDTGERGRGNVTLRPIKSVEILSSGKLDYTYGDVYTPNQSGGSGNRGMQIRISYETTYDHGYTGNVTQEVLDYKISSYTANRTPISSFEERGLDVYYTKDADWTVDTVGGATPDKLAYQAPLSVSQHDKAYLIVAGKRGNQANMVHSGIQENIHLTVAPKVLTLWADDQYRAYGEDNATPTFTFNIADLAAQDQKILTGLDPTLAGRISGDWLAKEKLGLDYTAPQFAHTAAYNSNVLNEGKEGYKIVLNEEQGTAGSLANYTLKYEGGTLYIFPRRVNIAYFKDDKNDPIYTMYNDMSEKIITTNAYLGRFPDDPKMPNKLTAHNDFALEIDTRTYKVYSADGREHDLTLSTTHADPKTGIIKDDAMALSITVQYKDLDMNDLKEIYDVVVTNAQIVSGYGDDAVNAVRNYVLDTSGDSVYIRNNISKGAVALRSISSIRIVGAPEKLTYAYGDDVNGQLNLWGLIVSITYTAGTTVVNDQTVIYRQNEDFAAQGLHVNYYPYAQLVGEDVRNPAKIPDKYYTASTGDHVTIAPTHDSMANYSEGDPKYNFSADGMYLVVTAQRADNQSAVAEMVTKDGKAVQIHVNPKPITFELSAQDKTYDSTTEAAGSITLKGVYNQSGYVDATNRDVTDVVYPMMGTKMELTEWANANLSAKKRMENFADYVSDQNGYVFTTGQYTWEERELWEKNVKIDWTDGYDYGADGVAKFSFLDPNVAYKTGDDFTGTVIKQPVQVTGLRLGGADAANYTLAGITLDEFNSGKAIDVTRETLSGLVASGSYGETTLPQGTIYKANRAALNTALPKVEVDPNTNVVRIVYDQSLSVIEGGEGPGHTGELGFEYALQYKTTVDTVAGDEDSEPATTTVVGQWAGEDGQSTWWDGRYFGGEAVSLDYPEGYTPRAEDLSLGSTDDVAKGQVYQWADADTGFQIDPGAYLGGAGASSDYYLYATDRTALARDTVYWALVRAVETHNYNASPILSSVSGYDAPKVQAVLDGWEAMERGDGPEGLETASQVALEAVESATDSAQQDAASESALMAEIAESGKWPETWTNRAAAAAVKTYAQRLDLISVKSLKSASGQSNTDYQVPTLEAVWFTDVLEYAEEANMDAVARNMDPVRYYSYAWDPDSSAPLFDGDEGLSLADSFEVEVRASGSGEGKITVNEDHIARIYVGLVPPRSGGAESSGSATSIRINSGDLELPLDTKPFQLTATVLPRSASQAVIWTSSDTEVAVIDEDGWVTLIGPGETVITAMTTNNLSDSIIITVLEEEEEEPTGVSRYPDGIFNDWYLEPFFDLEGADEFFHPGWTMTRGEVAQVLAHFYRENPTWTKTGPDHFADITGEEPYAEAVLILSRHGVIQGMPGGNFGGEMTISRAEFIVMLVRMLGLEVPDTTGQPHAFLDTGERDTWAYREIDAMSKVPGVLMGVGEGYFAPKGALTREEAAAFLSRLLQFPQVGEDPKIPRDVKEGYWGWDPILRAVNVGDRSKPRYTELTEETDETEKRS